MHLYTFILDYGGGTYISQVSAISKKEACVEWAQNLKISEIFGLGRIGKESTIRQRNEESPVAVADVANVWCTDALIRGKLALIHFVLTARQFPRGGENK